MSAPQSPLTKTERITHTVWAYFHAIRLRATAIMLAEHNDPRAIAWGHVLECDLSLRLGLGPPTHPLAAARYLAIKRAIEEYHAKAVAAA